MFGLFKKKKSFVDIWGGTPEIHCHVLPNIDDGAKDPETSKQLLEKYAQLGCTQVIATPHTMSGIYDNTPATIKNAFNKVSVPEGCNLSYSSEYMLDENFDQILEQNALIPLRYNYILVEMSYFQPPENLLNIIDKICVKGFTPILAHPERYAYYNHKFDIFNEFKRLGCLLQLNALSLSPHYGPGVQKTALRLLSTDAYDLIGIDTHRLEHLEKIENLLIPSKIENHLKTVCTTTQSIFLD